MGSIQSSLISNTKKSPTGSVVVVAVDERESSNVAFEWACNHTTPDDTIILVNAYLIKTAGKYPIDYLDIIEDDETLSEVNKKLKDNSTALLQKYMDRCHEFGRQCKMNALSVHSQAQIPYSINRYVENEHANQLFVGASNLKGLSRIFLGNISEGLLSKSSITVTVVRKEERQSDTE